MTYRPRYGALFGAMIAALMLLATPILVAAQDEPDNRCTDPPPEPSVACADPVSEPEVAGVIVWVEATDDGAIIYLTPEGIAQGRSCQGAAELVTMASDLYARLPESERSRSDLLWANPALTREILAHAWAALAGAERSNPVNVVFSDFTGDPDTFQSRVYRGPMLAAMCPG